MKILKWLGALLVISAIGNLGKMFFTHSMSAIDKNMQKATAEVALKLPATDDMGLTLTRISYSSPTLRKYFSVPKGGDPEKQYKQQLTNELCKEDVLWMFKKGLRIENIFQIAPASNASVFDMSMPDTTIVIDDQQCQHRGEPVPVYISPVPPTPVASINSASQVPAASQTSSPAYVVAEAPAATPADTAAAVN